jgi:hypothetical protein
MNWVVLLAKFVSINKNYMWDVIGSSTITCNQDDFLIPFRAWPWPRRLFLLVSFLKQGCFLWKTISISYWSNAIKIFHLQDYLENYM